MEEELQERQTLWEYRGKRIFLFKVPVAALADPGKEAPVIPPDVYSISFAGSRYTRKDCFVFIEGVLRTWTLPIAQFMKLLTDGRSIHMLNREIGAVTDMQQSGFFKERMGVWPPRTCNSAK